MVKKTVSWLLILLVMTMLSYLIFSNGDTNNLDLRAKNGMLNLANLADSDKVVELSGEWKFVANRYVGLANFPKSTTLENIPGPWDDDAKYGTLQLQIELPEHFKEVGIRVRNIWSAHRLFVDGVELASYGTLAIKKEDTVPSNPAYEVYITPTSRSITITLQVADFYNARHGVIFPIDIGEANTVAKEVAKAIFLEKTLLFILLLFSIFHISLYLLRTKDNAFFFSALYFTTLAFLVLFRGERTLQREFPSIHFELYFRLQDFITYINAVLFVFFIVYTVQEMMSRRKALLLTMPLILYAVAMLVFPARSLSFLQTVFFQYINVLTVVIISRLVFIFFTKKARIPKNELIVLGVSLVGLLIFAISGSFEQLPFSRRSIFVQVGILLFILGMNVFLAMRLINRTTAAEIVSEQLEKATIGKDSFLEVTTTELEQPLYHALNVTKSLASDQQLSEHRLLEQQLERLLYLVNDLKDFTRIRFQDFQINVLPVNLQMILQHIITMHERTMEKANIRLYIQSDAKLLIQADEQRVTQVVYRIVESAIMHAINGEVFITVIHLRSKVRITIEGTGPTVVHQIAADETGQSIGQAIIEQMGGTYKVDMLQDGIRFTLMLPFSGYDNEQKNKANHLLASQVASRNQDLPNLLIVEDDIVHAEILQSLLRNDYAIRLTHNADEALLAIEEEQPAFILIDEVMPGMDGLALTKKIRSQSSYMDLPIIMLVANEYPTNISLVLEAGANDYVRKPATKETILARLSTIALTKAMMNKAIEHEMAFLQAQIKPHFLYNALSSIISFCYTDGERAGHLLTMLSTYLRYIFDSGKEGYHATLERELEIISAYIEVEQARFGNRLKVQFIIDEAIDTAKVEVPCLLIQPLVENAIRHGIFEKEGNGCVTIQIERDENMLRICISDDGVGMTEAQVTALRKGENLPSDGIGFANVLRRIKELPNASLMITSEMDEGTTMDVKLPFKETSHVESYTGGR